jgi:hypothetical protein
MGEPPNIGREWLCLLFYLPAQRAQARVQAWRRLQRIGAVLLANSAYVLPASPEGREDFEWIKREIVGGGGEAIVLVARAPDVGTDEEVAAAFRTARSRDFEALAADARKLLRVASQSAAKRGSRQVTQGVRRLRERFSEKAAIDFLDAPGRNELAALLGKLDQLTGRKRTMDAARIDVPKASTYRDKEWITRPRPGVDRMSSAWLIRRFIDPNARFVFGEPGSAPVAVPFDTFEADFGHHGAHCTFETLCDRFAIADPGVRHIGRIVHDIDLKETKYEEAETPTISRIVDGLRRAHNDDDALLRSGMDVFEALYQSLADATRMQTKNPRRRVRPPSVKRRSKRR